MLKCLVCGAILSEGTKVCPVCGVTQENFVEIKEEKTEFSKNTDEIVMILGGGIAAVSAAEALRERNSTCGICILTDEDVLPYNRPMLTKDMKNASTDKILVHSKDWYDKENICVLTGKKVNKILPNIHELELDNGEKYYYDKCIYALGAEAFVPPFKGKDLNGVIAIRNVNDVKKVSEFIKSAEFAVVIGGGVLGLEAAWSLKESGIVNITVLETAERIMSRQIDAQAADYLTSIAKRNGIDIKTGINIDEIQGNDKVQSVLLSDGTSFPCDIVIVSCGIKSNIKVAKESGIETARAIIVDEFCHTNIPHIFACGDCAEFMGRNYALWAEAAEMGKVAGANAAGESLKFAFKAYPLTFNGMNTSLYAIGDNGTNPKASYTFEKIGDYDKRYYLNGKLCGEVIIGDTSRAKDIEI